MADEFVLPETSGIFVQGGGNFLKVEFIADQTKGADGQVIAVGLRTGPSADPNKSIDVIDSAGGVVKTINARDVARGPVWCELDKSVHVLQFRKDSGGIMMSQFKTTLADGRVPGVPRGEHGLRLLFTWIKD